MGSLPTNSSEVKAQEAAGLNDEQWAIFIRVTKSEAIYLRSNLLGKLWDDVPIDEKRRVLKAVNLNHRSYEMPEVKEDVLTWRMLRVMNELRETYLQDLRMGIAGGFSSDSNMNYGDERL